jgi:hypothetical protein
VEVVKEAGGNFTGSPNSHGNHLRAALILDTTKWTGIEGSIGVGLNFHFSEGPTVTAGF